MDINETKNTLTENNYYQQDNSDESNTISWDNPEIGIIIGEYKYKITGLSISHAIQNFYVGSTYILDSRKRDEVKLSTAWFIRISV